MGLFSWRGRAKRDSRGLTFDCTSEEQAQIRSEFAIFKDSRVHPSIAERLQSGITARALSHYADDQIMEAKLSEETSNKYSHLDKAIAAVGKAYSFYQAPIFLFELAEYLNLRGARSKAREMYVTFLEQQKAYKPDKLDELLLAEKDVESAVAQASRRI